MNIQDPDAWRRRYLRILTGSTDQDFDSQDDLQAIEDLVDDKMIRGGVTRGIDGVVCGAALVRAANGNTVPTLKGRLFIEDQKAFLKSKTFFGRLKTNWPLFSGIFGIIIGWSLGLVSPIIQQRLYPQVQQQHNANPTTNLTQNASAQQHPLTKPATPVSTNQATP